MGALLKYNVQECSLELPFEGVSDGEKAICLLVAWFVLIKQCVSLRVNRDKKDYGEIIAVFFIRRY